MQRKTPQARGLQGFGIWRRRRLPKRADFVCFFRTGHKNRPQNHFFELAKRMFSSARATMSASALSTLSRRKQAQRPKRIG